MKFRNFKMVDYVVYGRRSFDQLEEIIAPRRKDGAPMIFLLDHFFKDDAALKSRIPVHGNDMLIDVDITHEPKTTYVDELADTIKSKCGKASGVIGIGGGSAMDLAKAVSIMITNPGKAYEYQGWDLVQQPA